MDDEIWKDIPEFEGLYQVSTYGRVKSFHTKKGKILKQRINRRGYCYVTLYNNDETKQKSVHSLVVLTFIGPYPKGMEINHINGIKLDNTVNNLEYCTHIFNVEHAKKNKLYKYGDESSSRKNPETVSRGNKHYTKQHPELVARGEKAGPSKLKDKQIKEIRTLYNSGSFTQRDLAKMFNTKQQNIFAIVNNKSWKHLS